MPLVLEPGVCAPGFHVATVSELLDIGTYDYDYIHGITSMDSGLGTTDDTGWLRSGMSKPDSFANCENWSNPAPTASGVAIMVKFLGGRIDVEPASDWLRIVPASCSNSLSVWCSE